MNITINYHPLSGPMSDGMKKINGLHDQHTADGAGGPPPLPEKLPPEIPSGISVRESAVAGVPCLAVDAGGSKPNAFLYIHGGGFMFDSAKEGLHILIRAAELYHVDGFSVDYTLMPNAFYPTQLEECAAVYQQLIADGYKNIVVSGFSAGANLALALGFYCMQHKLPLPKGIAAISPPLDFTGFIKPETPDYLSGDNGLGAVYANGADLHDPCISSFFADYNGYPNLLLVAGTGESLITSCKCLTGQLLREKTGCQVTLSIWESMKHGFVLDSCFYPEAEPARDYVLQTMYQWLPQN